MTTDIARGALLSSTLVSAIMILFITIMTRKFIFVLLILITVGVSGYLSYLVETNSDILTKVGKFVDKQTKKLVAFYAKTKSP